MANPVLTRELRGRWRRPVTHIILFAYGALLALLMGAVYAYSVSGVNLAENNANSLLGRKLFSGFLSVQTGVWMLLSGALTAPSIAGERERGLLQGVLLSAVTPGAVVRGKLVSSLGFIALLLLVPMPVTALCFTLGGLAPWEFVTAFLLLGSTAVSGACLGLAISACNRRSDAALLTTFLTTLTLSWPPVLVTLTFEQTYFEAGAILCMIYQAILTAAAVGVAADAVENVLPERESEYYYNGPALRQAAFGTPEDTINGIVLGREAEDLSYDRAALYPSQLPPDIEAPEPQFAAPRMTKKPRKTWKDTPLSARVNFKNPVMQHEVRARLRRRAADFISDEYQSVDYTIVVVFFVLLLLLIALLSGTALELSALWLLGAMATAAVLGAFTFVREREQNTLQPLLMTLLSPGEVLLGKLGAACFMGAVYTTPFLLTILPGALTNWLLLPLVFLLGAGAIWLGAAIGISFSWICRQAGVAVAGAIAAVFVTFAATWNIAFYLQQQSVNLPLTLNLVIFQPSIFHANTAGSWPALFRYALPVTAFWLLAGALLLLIVRIQLRPSTMKKDGSSIWNRDLTKEYS